MAMPWGQRQGRGDGGGAAGTATGLRGCLECRRLSREGGYPVDKQLIIKRNGKRQTNTTPAKNVALTRGHIGLDSRLRGNDDLGAQKRRRRPQSRHPQTLSTKQ